MHSVPDNLQARSHRQRLPNATDSHQGGRRPRPRKPQVPFGNHGVDKRRRRHHAHVHCARTRDVWGFAGARAMFCDGLAHIGGSRWLARVHRSAVGAACWPCPRARGRSRRGHDRCTVLRVWSECVLVRGANRALVSSLAPLVCLCSAVASTLASPPRDRDDAGINRMRAAATSWGACLGARPKVHRMGKSDRGTQWQPGGGAEMMRTPCGSHDNKRSWLLGSQ